MKIIYNNKLQRLVITGVLAAVLAVLSPISIPTPIGVPITLQTFGVALCGYVLGPALGSCAVLVYMFLGAVGLPVLAGFSGGIGFFLGVTGGFLWGFPIMAFFCGRGVRTGNKLLSILLGIAGLIICHMFGILQFSIVTSTSVLQSFLIMSLPYIFKDALFVALAYLVSISVIHSLKRAHLVKVE